MDRQDIRTLKILEKVESDSTSSQRDLARELNISLGLVNSFIKRLVKKGYFKIKHIPKNRIRYILTTRGMTEKSRLTYEYVQLSYQFYKDARKKMRDLYADLEKQGVAHIVFYGAGDLAEIAFISLQQTGIELAAVVDDEKNGERFMHLVVAPALRLESLRFDKILITSINSPEFILEKLTILGIAPEKVVQIK